MNSLDSSAFKKKYIQIEMREIMEGISKFKKLQQIRPQLYPVVCSAGDNVSDGSFDH